MAMTADELYQKISVLVKCAEHLMKVKDLPVKLETYVTGSDSGCDVQLNWLSKNEDGTTEELLCVATFHVNYRSGFDIFLRWLDCQTRFGDVFDEK